MGFDWGRGLIVGVMTFIVTWSITFPLQLIFPGSIEYIRGVVESVVIFSLTQAVYLRRRTEIQNRELFFLGVLSSMVLFAAEAGLLVIGWNMGWDIFFHWTKWVQYALVAVVPSFVLLFRRTDDD